MIFILLIIILFFIYIYINNKNNDILYNNLKSELKYTNDKLLEANNTIIESSKINQNLLLLLDTEKKKNEKVVSQSKSSQARVGHITENLVPFLEGCPFRPQDMHFLGKPFDYLVTDFDDGSIHFVEVKSGNSVESKRQKTIKNIIKAGRVYYTCIRINEKGMIVKKAENLK